MLPNWTFVQGLQEDIGKGRRSEQRGGQREEHPYKFSEEEAIWLFSTVWACRVLLIKVLLSCVMYWVKKFRYSGLTNCVHVINKSRGSGMHWVGGGVKVHQDSGQYPPCNGWIYLCECRRFRFFILAIVPEVFFVFYIAIKWRFADVDLCVQ